AGSESDAMRARATWGRPALDAAACTPGQSRRRRPSEGHRAPAAADRHAPVSRAANGARATSARLPGAARPPLAVAQTPGPPAPYTSPENSPPPRRATLRLRTRGTGTEPQAARARRRATRGAWTTAPTGAARWRRPPRRRTG